MHITPLNSNYLTVQQIQAYPLEPSCQLIHTDIKPDAFVDIFPTE